MLFYVCKDDPGLRDDTYELCYNSACLSLGQNEVGAAQTKLKKAEGVKAIYVKDLCCWSCVQVQQNALVRI